MIPVLSRDEMRRFDAHAIEACGVPGALLMENAGRGAAELIERHYSTAERRVLVVAGPGNNGGDGFVVARRLLARGAVVRTVLLGREASLTGDAAVQYGALRGVGGDVLVLAGEQLDALAAELERAEVVVDALFGTGLSRPIQGVWARALELMNRAPARKVALDVPSGLDCDTGRALGIALRADLTVTFAHFKRGLLTPSGARHAGLVEQADIGVPGTLVASSGYSAELVEPRDVARALGRRDAEAHKGSSGRVIVLAGSPGKIGAALLVAHGALRAGAGLVTIAARPEAQAQLDLRVLEAMTARIDPADLVKSLEPLLASAGAVAIGPGLGLDDAARRLVDHVVFGWDGVKVLDADALTHCAGRADALANAPGRLVLTPHPGEMARLIGSSAPEVEADRFGAVTRAVELTRATVLLKGAHTLIGAPGERVVVNARGSSALATGGTGDVLCGVLSALAVGVPAREASYSAAYLHARAAELWSARRAGADRGLLAHEAADLVPLALAELASTGAALTS